MANSVDEKRLVEYRFIASRPLLVVALLTLSIVGGMTLAADALDLTGIHEWRSPPISRHLFSVVLGVGSGMVSVRNSRRKLGATRRAHER